ncbi:MAG: ImmA/IrrE family metallo-endopeptidase [Lachnospiraceae bacterium]|nr:ImmA/IrrE family metallo-endopeptidase [Lachnospiraceae bacterium]
MDISKGKKIIDFNREQKERINRELERFYVQSGATYGSTLQFGSWDYVKMIASKFSVLSVFLPMKDKELGALLYHTKEISYMLVNSAIPQANRNFAYCHELYHAMNPGKMLLKHGLEMFLDMDYQDSEDEKMANAFAGGLMMPEEKIKGAYAAFQKESESVQETTARTAECFSAPFAAAAIRIFELGLCNDAGELEKLLNMRKEEIYKLYEKYWLNTEHLKPSGSNQFASLKKLMETQAVKLQEEDLLSDKDAKYILRKLEQLYREIGEER